MTKEIIKSPRWDLDKWWIKDRFLITREKAWGNGYDQMMRRSRLDGWINEQLKSKEQAR